jgi:hypothetical protein
MKEVPRKSCLLYVYLNNLSRTIANNVIQHNAWHEFVIYYYPVVKLYEKLLFTNCAVKFLSQFLFMLIKYSVSAYSHNALITVFYYKTLHSHNCYSD